MYLQPVPVQGVTLWDIALMIPLLLLLLLLRWPRVCCFRELAEREALLRNHAAEEARQWVSGCRGGSCWVCSGCFLA